MVQLVKMASNRFLHQLCLYAGIISVVMLGAECATYGESCDANNPCTDMSLYCSGTCGCTSGYNYQGSGDTCQPLIEYINPGYRFKTSSKFPTNMENSDLTELRQETLRSDLGPQLEKLFHNVTGFVEVSFGAISIPTNNVLEIEYTVVIDSQDPAFTGKTRDEVHDLLLNDLSQVAPKYNESIILDTSRHEYKGDDTVDDTSIAIGVGVGVGGLVIILVIVALAMFLCKRRSKQAAPVTKKEPAVTSPGTISSNCSTSGRSTQLDADDYKYSVFLKDGLSFPPHYATKVPASSSSGSVYAVVDDTNPLYQN